MNLQELLSTGGLVGIVVLIISQFLQLAKMFGFTLKKNNSLPKEKMDHTEPCISLQTLEGRVRKQNEKSISEIGELKTDVQVVKTDVSWMRSQLEKETKSKR